VLTGAGLLPGAGFMCAPPRCWWGECGARRWKGLSRRGGLAIPSLSSVDQHKIAANSGVKAVL